MILDDENILMEDLKNTVNWPSLIEDQFNNSVTYPNYEAYVNSLNRLIKQLNNTCKIADGIWFAIKTNEIIFGKDLISDELLKFEFILSPAGNYLNVILSTRRDILKRCNVNNECLQNIVDLLATQTGYEIISNDSHRIIYSKFC
jgi:hypothetical protein